MIGSKNYMRFWRKEVLLRDDYKLRDLPVGYFDVILDIGANMGLFSVYARCLQPSARIIAIEPLPALFKVLQANARGLNVELMNCALGNGQTLHQINPRAFCPQFASVGEVDIPEDAIQIPSKTLVDIFTECNIQQTSRYMIKMDCEGGERFAILDENIELFTHATQISVELHCAKKHGSHMPPREVFITYFEQFSNTHTVDIKGKNIILCVLRKK